jgi:hypothetical protein
MAKKTVNIGTSANKGNGDPLRTAFGKINDNFDEIYTALGSDGDLFDPSSVDQSLVPTTTNTVDLGSASKQWRSLYVSNNTIYIGGVAIGVDGNGNLTTGGTVVGSTPDWANITGKPTIPTSFDRLVNGANTLSLGEDGDLAAPGDITTGTNGGRFVQDCGDGITSIRWINVEVDADSTQLIRIYSGDPGEESGDAERAQIGLNWQNDDQSGLTIKSFDQDSNEEHDWEFRGDGDLRLPGNIESADVLDITAQNQIRLVSEYNSVQIRTNAASEDTYIWTFGSTGTLTLPGSLTLPGDIKSENAINIDINLTDSTLRRWRFGEDGDLTLPADAVIQTTSGNLTIEAEDYVIIDSSTDGQIEIGRNSGVGAAILGNKSRGTNAIVDSDLMINNGVYEKFSSLADATGTVTHNCSNGHIFYHTSPDANWTVNLTNLNSISGRATSATLIIAQGGTGYYPNALQIAGAAQTINWQGNVNPTPSTNRTDVVTFSIINNSGTYTVLGQLTGF